MDIGIIKIDSYRDGGTISIETNLGTFCIDGRINSKTKGKLFIGYPDKSELVNNPDLEFNILRELNLWKANITEYDRLKEQNEKLKDQRDHCKK